MELHSSVSDKDERAHRTRPYRSTDGGWNYHCLLWFLPIYHFYPDCSLSLFLSLFFERSMNITLIMSVRTMRSTINNNTHRNTPIEIFISSCQMQLLKRVVDRNIKNTEFLWFISFWSPQYIETHFNTSKSSFFYMNVLKRRFSVFLTAWVKCPCMKFKCFYKELILMHLVAWMICFSMISFLKILAHRENLFSAFDDWFITFFWNFF